MRTLLLNASFEPLAVVPLRRAVVLVLSDKAVIVESGDGEIRGATASVPVPSVIRLTRYVKVPYRGTLPLTRRTLMARDNHRCAYCAKTANTVDHVTPRSRGGAHAWENVVAACARCNGRKGDSLLSELGWALPFEPYAPKGLRYVIVAVGSLEPSWEPYLAYARA